MSLSLQQKHYFTGFYQVFSRQSSAKIYNQYRKLIQQVMLTNKLLGKIAVAACHASGLRRVMTASTEHDSFMALGPIVHMVV